MRPSVWFTKFIDSQPESEKEDCKRLILEKFLTQKDERQMDHTGDIHSKFDIYIKALEAVSASSANLFLCDTDSGGIIGIHNPRAQSKPGKFPTRTYYFDEEHVERWGKENPQLASISKQGTKKFMTLHNTLNDEVHGINNSNFMVNFMNSGVFNSSGSSRDQMPSSTITQPKPRVIKEENNCINSELKKVLETNIGIRPDNPEAYNMLLIHCLEDYAPQIKKEADKRLDIASFSRAKEIARLQEA